MVIYNTSGSYYLLSLLVVVSTLAPRFLASIEQTVFLSEEANCLIFSALFLQFISSYHINAVRSKLLCFIFLVSVLRGDQSSFSMCTCGELEMVIAGIEH